MTFHPSSRTPISRYGVAVILSLAVVGIRGALQPMLGAILPLQLLTFAVVVAAWWGGLGPGLLATAACAVAGHFLFLLPRGSFALPTMPDSLHLLVFIGTGVAISAIAEALHRAARDAQAQKEALRVSEERLRLAVKATEDAVWDWDIATDTLGWSPAVAERFGWPEAPPGTDTGWWQERIHPDDRERVIASLREVITDHARHHWSAEYRFLRGDGTVAEAFDRGSVLRDVEGRAVRMIGAMLDLSERKQAEAAVREAAEQRRLALEAAELGAWDFRFQTGEVFGDERFFRMLGASGEKLSYEGALERLHPDDRTSAHEAVQAALAGAHEGRFRREMRVIWPDGSLRWVAAHGRVYFAGSGAAQVPLHFTGICLDITERKRAMEELRLTTDRFEAALRASPAVVFEQDRELRYTWIHNSKIGLTTSGVLGKTDFELMERPEDAEVNVRLRREVMQTGVGQRVELRAQAGGKLRDYDISIEPRRDEGGQVVGVICAAVDVTARVLASERLGAALAAAEAANRAKDAFLAALSHELRTPLTPVLFLAATLERSPEVAPALREDFAMIRRNIELEARLIDDLLDLTRISRGKLQLDLQPTDLHAVLTRSLELLRGEIETRRLRLTVELAADPAQASADPVRLQQVFWNVLKNAVKFTPEGGSISVRSGNAEAGSWHLAVADSGLGITAEELPFIFDAFAQGEEATSHRFGGLGLGLAISSLLVGEHGGRIWAESAGRGQGATFHLELPLATAPVAPEADGLPAVTAPAAPLRRILFVEDHEPTRLTLERLLKKRGYDVTIAATLEHARELAAAGPFDLMISDLGLPDGSGHDLAAEFGRAYEMKAIALSGYGMEEDVRRSEAAGFLAHITKPVDIEALHEAILRALQPHGVPTAQNLNAKKTAPTISA